TWVGPAGEPQRRRTEQLDDVGSADGAIVAGAGPNVAHRGKFAGDLVGVGAEVIVRNLVIGIAEAAGERQLFEEGMANDRDLHFGEELANVERASDRWGRTARTGEVTALELGVGLEVERFLSILGASVKADAAIGPRRLQAI